MCTYPLRPLSALFLPPCALAAVSLISTHYYDRIVEEVMPVQGLPSDSIARHYVYQYSPAPVSAYVMCLLGEANVRIGFRHPTLLHITLIGEEGSLGEEEGSVCG